MLAALAVGAGPDAGRRRGLQQRLYTALREAVLAGRLAPGARLPATRALADEAGIARQTVVLVYQRLVDEGYAVARVGAGTFVSSALPLEPARAAAPGAAGAAARVPAPVPPGPAAESPLPLGEGQGPKSGGPRQRAIQNPKSAWAGRALAVSRDPHATWSPEGPAFDFRPGVPDWETFPHTLWRRLLARRWTAAGRLPALAALGHYGDPAGYRPLREALAAYLARSRGVRCAPDQVVIVSGSQQALDLLARVCLDPGDTAAMEEPGYPAARSILRAAGAHVRPVPVDPAGLVVGALERPSSGGRDDGADEGRRAKGESPGRAPAFVLRPSSFASPKLVYVTPSHQYPTGATLSLPRRLALLEWAARAGALIVEDDYDSELRYAGPPLPALQGLDTRGCVAYVGSCSTVLFPPLRLGWIVAPPALVEALIAAKWLADRQTATLEQQVLADFIAGGHFARHLRRSRARYGARRAALLAAVERSLPPDCVLAGEPAGLQTPLYLPPGVAEEAVAAAAAARGVGVYPIGPCYHTGAETRATDAAGATDSTGAGASPPPRPGLLLGFAAMREAAIDEGIRRLAAALHAVSSS